MPLPLVGVESHGRLPLLEEPHGLELLEEGKLLEDLVRHSVLDVLVVGDELGDLIVVSGHADEAILAEDDLASVVLGWLPVFSVDHVGSLVLDLLQGQEDLALLLHLSQQVSYLLSRVGLRLDHVSVSQQRHLSVLWPWSF